MKTENKSKIKESLLKSKKIIFKFWEIYLIAVGIGLIVTGLSLLAKKPLELIFPGFIILAFGAIIMAINSIKDQENKK